MKQIIISILFVLTAISYVNSQTVVKLLLPDNCDSNTSSVSNLKSENDFKLQVSPNPTNGKFVLNVSSTENIGKAIINIYTQLGETIYTETVYCSSEKLAKQIHLKNLLSGIYLIKLSTETKEIATKLIIK
ncbi:MAG: T9SS type A sorting domain-containing protein [Salinivirgaceae bacterium]|nr:T9SS type A sorting domain-containing protein [Salinivirgaceae bacterium]